jgi:hypothetical protein
MDWTCSKIGWGGELGIYLTVIQRKEEREGID